jgi:SAM-dependent methyltransferase
MAAVGFDRIAEIYDETRRPPAPETIDGVLRALSAHRCRSILEIGVGTARVSAPLMRAGVEVTGMDLSRPMMERARSKGLANLLQGDGMAPPFRRESFDAVLMAHVLHIVQSPSDLLRESAGVSRVGVFALIRNRDEGSRWYPFSGGPESTERRRWLRALAEKYNWSWEENRTHDWDRERDLVKNDPPDELNQVSDVTVTESLEERIGWIREGAFTFFARMPEGMRDEIIGEMRRRAPTEGMRTRREVYQLAFWRSPRG